MSNLEHELMAAERALRAVAEMTGAQYVAFHFYGDCIRKLGVSIHNGGLVRSRNGDILPDAYEAAVMADALNADAIRAAKEADQAA